MITEAGLKPSIIFRVIWKRNLFYLLFSIGVVVTYDFWGEHIQFPDTPLSIFGTLLAILLGFRVNNAYQRWWEARKLWGKIVNDSRSSARQTINYLADKAPDSARRIVYRHMGWCYSLRNHLRGLPKETDLEQFFSEEEFRYFTSQVNVPNAIMTANSRDVEELVRDGLLSDMQQRSLEERYSIFLDSQGGCERIKKTVFPYDYRFYTTMFVNAFSVIFPFILVDEADWQTVPWTVFVAFALSSIDHLAKAIETPFENRPNDTAMTAISRTIEIDLRQMLGETELPKPTQPVDGYLM